MKKNLRIPDYVFEVSWEVCNLVGGIYTVLSTKAKTLQERYGDNLIFIGPDLWKVNKSPYFTESKQLLSGWRKQAKKEGLNIKIGRWDVPGNPIVILLGF